MCHAHAASMCFSIHQMYVSFFELMTLHPYSLAQSAQLLVTTQMIKPLLAKFLLLLLLRACSASGSCEAGQFGAIKEAHASHSFHSFLPLVLDR